VSARSAWRLLLAPGLVSLVGVAILLGLGAWQIERMGAKQRLIARVEQRSTQPPQALPPEQAWSELQPKGYDYTRVQLSGLFQHDKEAHLHGLLPRGSRDAVQGYFILTPLLRPDGSTVLINRGFVPTERIDPATRRDGQVAGEQTIIGLMRAPQPRGWFTPPDDPARNSWFTRDPKAIGEAFGLHRLAPFVVEADAAPNPGGLPVGGTTVVTFRDNHLQYALTWFALALSLIGVFGVWARRAVRAAGLSGLSAPRANSTLRGEEE
jgi:surfeit locus 1 family protein